MWISRPKFCDITTVFLVREEPFVLPQDTSKRAKPRLARNKGHWRVVELRSWTRLGGCLLQRGTTRRQLQRPPPTLTAGWGSIQQVWPVAQLFHWWQNVIRLAWGWPFTLKDIRQWITLHGPENAKHSLQMLWPSCENGGVKMIPTIPTYEFQVRFLY